MIYFKEYPNYISVLMKDFLQATEDFPGSEINKIAHDLIEGAIEMDRAKALHLPVHFKFGAIERNEQSPPEFEHTEILKAEWADKADHPLQGGEEWNKARRATATGQSYELDDRGRPINPYMQTGINGRGILGAFGPNHAVDNGMLVVKDDEQGNPALYALGILRKFDNNAPALAGGFAKYANGDTSALDFDSMAQNQTDEFFEEVISGSVALLPEFEILIDERLRDALKAYTEHDEEHFEEIRGQVITALKMEQVEKYDPDFLRRLKQHIASGHECFAGPVLNDPRTTNNAWIESRLSWVIFDDTSWNAIKGDDKFGYEFAGGDDASGTVFHKIDPQTIETAFASHGSMICYMAASFILEQQKNNIPLHQNVLQQLNDVAEYLLQPGL